MSNDIASREDIFACDRPAALYAWHADAQDILDSIKAQVEMNDLLEIDEGDNWAIRARDKATYARIGMKRIERRLLELGCDLPASSDSALAEQLRRVKGAVNRLHALCERNGVDSRHISF